MSTLAFRFPTWDPPGQGRIGFLVAGVQKGGTTALFDYLVEHPDLSLPVVKEAHFFDDETNVDWSRPDYAPYEALFSADPGGRRLRGEATPIYLYWPNSLERIAAYNPEMRLILIFRDPIERALSHWKMEYARGAETEPFAWCVRDGRARVATDPNAPGFHRVYSYVERGFYGAQLRRLLSIFPREQLLFLRSDDLRAEPERILCTVCDFLNAPPFGRIEAKESHVAKTIDYGAGITEDDRAYLKSVFEDDQIIFTRLSGISFPLFT
ncbi:sulfotransferase [Caulobacter sp. BP25]|uniref:sulfotransferase family protein n=1 Tax=Caulobacter sp. BP25 TaxID=2048900 RepID=UPI000C12A7EF|nr:sulfotransferase domain-containing protein [Caulobacter sp. BP25]PHY19623.1 sulfotransferase [Caulobacter sp. BP25]